MGDDGPDVLSDAERRFLIALDELGVRYLLVGMSAALLQGARGATENIDLWFETLGDPRIGEAARHAGGFWVTRSQPPILGGEIGDRFDVVTTLSGIADFASELASAVELELDGIPVRLLPLDRILHSKRTANRAKDAPGIQQIEIALEVMRRRT